MTAARSVPAEGYPAPREQELTPDQAVAHAERIAATLVDRQAETEQRGQYALDTHNDLLTSGLYRLQVPRRYGGHELDLGTYLKVVTVLANSCPSTGWMYTFGSAHALQAATLFGERAQEELFGTPDFICPATVGPVGFAERAEDGGWIVDGVHPYSSGSPYATHFIGHTLLAGDDGAPPEPMMFIVPRAQWRRLDDWGATLGLKGSGSHSVVLEKAHIPEYFGLPGTHLGTTTVVDGTPGRDLHGSMYGGGVLSSLQLQLAALAIGMASGALDAYAELMRERKTIFPPVTLRAENPDYQYHYGEAAGRIATAEAALAGGVRQWEDNAERGAAACTRAEDLRLTTIVRQIIRLCWGAMSEHLFPTAGSSAVRSGARIERIWRDMSTLHSHAGVAVFLNTLANRELAKQVFDVAS